MWKCRLSCSSWAKNTTTTTRSTITCTLQVAQKIQNIYSAQVNHTCARRGNQRTLAHIQTKHTYKYKSYKCKGIEGGCYLYCFWFGFWKQLWSYSFYSFRVYFAAAAIDEPQHGNKRSATKQGKRSRLLVEQMPYPNHWYISQFSRSIFFFRFLYVAQRRLRTSWFCFYSEIFLLQL